MISALLTEAAQALPADWNQVLTWLLGPLGLTVGLILVVVGFLREWVVPGTRYRRDIAALQTLLDTYADTVDGIAKATEERNRNEQAKLDLLRGSAGLAAGLTDAEDQIHRRRRTT